MNRAKVTLSLIFLAGLMTLPLSGCQRQQQGERCDLDNADDDCDQGDDLVCTDSAKLREGDDKVSRCCPEDLKDSSDSRCAPKQGGTGDGDGDSGLGGNGGADGSSGTGGSGMGGDDSTVGLNDEGEPCNFDSDCLVNLVCGPAARCQIECKQDRDCAEGKTCDMSNNTCE